MWASMILKDIKVIVRDKKILAIIILMPIVLMTILGTAFSGMGEPEAEFFKRNIAIVKNYDAQKDNSDLNKYMKSQFNINLTETNFDIEQILFDDFLGNDELKKVISYEILNEDEAIKKLKSDEVDAIVIFPEKFVFDSNINMLTPFRNKIDIQIYNGEGKELTGQILKGLFGSFTDKIDSLVISKNIFIENAIAAGGTNDVYKEIENIVKEYGTELETLAKIEEGKHSGRKSIDSKQYYAIAMMTMFLLFVASNGSKIFIMEKENKTLDRTIISGVATYKIMLSKFITISLIALVQGIVMIFYSKLALGIDWGEPKLVAAALITTSLSVGAFGSLIGAVAFKNESERWTEFFESFFFQAMALVGGNYFFFGALPDFINNLSLFTLNGVALRLYLGISTEININQIYFYFSILGDMSIVFILLSIIILRKESHKNV